MGSVQNDSYRKGYIAGYRDGLKAAERGQTPQMEGNSIAKLPIQAMAVSTRAKNCLLHAGCWYVLDVIALDEHRISTMRNLGKRSASEVGRWLEGNGVCHSAWSRFITP